MYSVAGESHTFAAAQKLDLLQRDDTFNLNYSNNQYNNNIGKINTKLNKKKEKKIRDLNSSCQSSPQKY